MHSMHQWPDPNEVAEIAAFAAVAEQGSFTKAAAVLGRDATVLSRRVQSLEQRLGVRLLTRTTRHLALTEAGSAFLARAKTIQAALTEAREEAATLGGGEPRGTLRLALPGTFGRMWIAPYLPDFLAAYPHVRVDASYSNRFVDLVAEGFDAAVRLAELADSRLVARRIAPRRRLLCASPCFLQRRGAPSRPEDLQRLPCLGFTGLASHLNWTFSNARGESVTVRADGPLVSDDAQGLVHAAERGLGIMLCTDWLVGRELAEGTLVPVLTEWLPRDEGAIYTVVPSNRLLPAKTRAFIDWIAARYSPIAPWRGPLTGPMDR
ncbi:LysR family transcriptional regulator [Trinickia diaoshuihuensis]|uniref:LysR family transcriptional regulator n=1 Tax=Trinickia diaoshuihuensis TaxID=2292265 RepID=UPI0019683937|nr:LysR family transcriptional regulator [Trinickia diaoshuihuensis]